MALDEIKFKISADMDFGDAKNQVELMKKGILDLQGAIGNMPNVSKILDNSLEKTASIATSLSNKLDRLRSGNFRSDSERAALEKSISNDVSELNTLKSLQSGQGDFSVSLAKSWFGDLPNAVQRELDSVIPKVASIIKTRTSSLSGGNRAFNGKTQTEIASQAIQDPEVKALASRYLKSQMSRDQFKQIVQDIIPHIVPASRLNGYQVRRYGSVLQNEATALAKGNVVDLFPQSYRNAYNSKGYVKRKFAEQQGGMVLDANSVKELNQMLATRPIMAKAAIISGISRRNGQGILETKREISRQEWENYRSALYDELMTRAAGYGKNKVDPYSIVKEDVKKLTSRLTSSTSGDTMTGMHDIEKFENAQYWTTGTGSKKYSQVRKEGRRAMDEYVVRKYSPFLRRSNGTEVSPQEVMINESHNTRLLGGGKWKNNDDVSDTISLISLAGYDPKNKEHQAQLLDLYRNGRVINGKQYIAQSTHGKGEDQVVRMIEKSAYDRVAKQEEQWAKTRHIRGSYWGGFNDAEIQRKIMSEEDPITAKDWGKHLEMLNKAWTPSVDAGLNLSKKRIAVVDFKGAGDGATWVSNKMMADSGQVRFGVGGKGSAFVFDGKNVGEFGRRTGIADENGRVMMPGPDGKLYDVSGYDMVVPLDAIKNQGAYKDENGNFYSGERASEIATALGRRYGIGMVANYSKEDISSNKIGTQMASFINFNPAVRDHQIEMAMQRMQELDTETGQLKYVFGDQNDWLSRKVNGDTQLLNTEAAKRRVDSYKQSLMNRLAGGEYINFDNDSGIADMRLVASPLAAYLTATGGIKDGKVLPSVIAKAREYLGENSDKYTDAEISNMIVPDKDTVLDFAHKDKDQVAVIRSPTGYGNMVHARNVAAAAEPIYKGFGITTNAGIYVSDQQLQTLQSADFDADQAKVIFNDALRQSVEETLKTQHYEEASVPKRTVEYSKEELADKNLQQVYFADRGAVMSSAMGAGSSGIRIMQLDLSKPSNQQYIKEAQRLADYYDTWTTHNKNAEEADIEDANAWGTFRLAKEYTKFSDNLNKFVMKEDEIPEELSEADIFKASNGKIVNLKALRDLGIDNVNLPAAYMANHVMGVAAQNNLYRNGGVDTTYMDAVGEAMQQMDYGDAGPARQKLMKTMRSLLTQFGTGERAMLSPPETRALSAMTENAMSELVEDSRKYLDPATGKYVYKNERGEIKTYDTEQNLAEARAKKYGILTARNAVGSFGMTEDRLYHIFGDDYSKKFSNASLSNIELLPEDKLAIEIKEQQENISDEIKAAQKEVSNEKGSKKRSNKKKTPQQKLIEKQIDNLGKQLGIKATDDIEQLIEGQEIALKTNIAGFNYANDEDKPTFSNAIQENKDRIKGLQEYKNLLAEKESLSKSPAQKRLDELLTQKAELDKQEQMALKTIDARTEYQSIIGAANEYATQMWAYQKGKENKINDSKSYAEKYYSKSDYERSAIFKTFDEFTDKISNSDLPKETIDEFQNGMNSARAEINKNVEKDFTNKAILYAKSLSENLEDELNKNQNAPSAQKRKIDSFNEQIDNAKSFTAFMNEKLTSGKLDPAYQKLYEDAVKSANKYIEAAEGTKEQLIGEYTKQNESSARLSYENLSIKYGLKSRNSLGVRSEARKREISNLRDVVNKQHNEGYFSEEEYSNITAQLDTLEQKSSEVSIAVQDMMNKTSVVISRVMQRLGRQLFMKALQETKRFVKEFDASMNEIQAITLKSNDQMASVRSNTISKALGLRTSVSNVATTEAALYRQGLSDAEVSSRTESIIKFATVTKLNVAEATKIITTALQNDLVPSAEQAMDALVALGDSAATTAAEIGKGMQKAAASAKVAGVSYSELTALLTIGTSDTQLSGTQVGTALQTVFSRMRRLSISGWTSDQNGNKTTASDAEAALKSVGVDLWDNKTIGKMRTGYEVLSDLAKVWQSLSDAQKNIVMNAMAGTRQTNVFSTLMEGMSEDNGATLDKYLGLAENSEGITQSKYEIAMQSLSAAMDELKSSWDAVVESFATGGSITGVLDIISDFLQGIANSTNLDHGFSVVVGGIIGIGAALAALTAANPGLKALAGILGIVAGLAATGAISSGINAIFTAETETERSARISAEQWNGVVNKQKYLSSQESSANNAIKKVEDAGKEWEKSASFENSNNLRIALQDLADTFPDVSSSCQTAISDLKEWSNVVGEAKDKVETLSQTNKGQIVKDTLAYIKDYTGYNYANYLKSISFVDNDLLADAKNNLVYGLKNQSIGRDKVGHRNITLDTDIADLAENGTAEEKAYALLAGYRENGTFKDLAKSIIKNDSLLELLGSQEYDPFVGGKLIDEAALEFDRIYNRIDSSSAESLYTDISAALSYAANQSGHINTAKRLNKYLTNDQFDTEAYKNSTKEENARTLYNAAAGSYAVQRWLDENHPGVREKLFADYDQYNERHKTPYRNLNEYSDVFGELSESVKNDSQVIKRRQAAISFLKEDIPSRIPFDIISTEDYSSDFLKNIFSKALANANIIGDNGNIDEEALNEFASKFLNGWVENGADYLNSFVSENAEKNDFDYYYENNDGTFVGFNDYSRAVEYGRTNGYDIQNLKTKNGTVAYQTADNLISAKLQEARVNNRQILLDDIVNGYSDVSGFRSMTEAERRAIVTERNKSGVDAQEDYRALMAGNLIAPLNSFGSLQDLKDAYASEGLDQELSKAVSQNSTAMLGWITDDINLVYQGLQQELTGHSTAQSKAVEIKSLVNKLTENNGRLFDKLKTDLEDGYKELSSYFGDENFKSIEVSIKSGTYEGSEWQRLVNQTIARNSLQHDAGLTQYTNAELAQDALSIMNGNYASLEEAALALRWTDSRYNAINGSYGSDLNKWLLMSQDQRKSIEGQNLKRDINIKISTTGISDLEEANKVLEGTTKLIENLQRGGEVSIKAKLDFDSKLYNMQQQEALLENGTELEQIDAIATITGLSRTQIKKDFRGSKDVARRLLSAERDITGETLNQIAFTDKAYADELARKYGYVGDPTKALEKVNEIYSGATNSTYIYNPSDGQIYSIDNVTGKKRLASSVVQDTFNANQDKYVYTGTATAPDREELTTGLTKSYTPQQIAQTQLSIMEGKLNAQNAPDYELYSQAFESLSDSQKDYLVMSRNEQSYTPEEIANARRKAYAENATWLEQQEEQKALEDARLLAGNSFDDASRYARLLYNHNNKGTIAANELYETFSGLEDKSYDSVLSLLNDESVKKNWEELLSSAPEITKEFEKAGLAVNEDGTINWEAIQEQEDGLDSALATLVSIITNHSADLQNAEYDTRKDIYNKAQTFLGLSDEDKISDTEYYSAYERIVGSDIAARERAANDDYVLDPIEQEYRDMRMQGFAEGRDGLTELERVNGAEGIFNAIKNGTYEETYGDLSQDMIHDFAGSVEGLEGLIKIYKESGNAADGFAEEQEKVSAALESSKYAATHFGDSANNVINTYKKLKGSTKDQLEAQKQISKNKDSLSKSTFFSENFGTSKVKNKDLASYLNLDEAYVKKLAKDNPIELKRMIDLQHEIDQQAVVDDANAQIMAVEDEVGSINVSDFGPNFVIGGTYDISQLEALAAEATAKGKAIIDSLIQSLAGLEGSVTFKADANGDTLRIRSANVRSTGGGYKGGGGGGGGKSAADKMLDIQKQRIANLDHVSKMLEIQEKYYDFVNDYSGYSNNIDQQVQNQERLRSAYAQNLEELKAQLAVVGQGTDDYNKLADAIRSTEESLASVNNTINELQAKKINIVAQQQENEDKPVNHQLAMLQKYAQRYQRSGQFESYVAIMEKTLQTSRHQIAVNNSQIKQWEGMLKEYYEGSDSWLEIRDKIWALKEENAELENQIASDLIELEEAKVAQIAQDLQNNNLSFDHVNNMLDMYGEMYQSTFNHQGYRSTLGDINENNVKMKEATDEAIEQVKQQIATMKATDPARQTAVQTLYELEEASAKYEADILKNRQAIEESFITEITQSHGDSSSIFEHEFKLLQEAEKSFMRDKDFVNYENIVKEEARNASERLAEQRSALEDYLALQDSGKITYGSQQWRSLEEQIRATKENIASLSNEYEELLDRVESVRFENLQRNFNEIDELAQHNLKMIQYEETRYQNRGELTNYGTLLAQDTDMQRERAGTIQQYIDDLKAQQAELQDNPELYDKISQEIYKWEENLSQVNNQIEKNVKLLKKNEEAIRKARQAVENVIDKEIRARIQKERDMLSATVSIENSIVDIIRQRYQNEWKLMKDDLNKKKQALNDEKGLINERLNARKEAIQKEEKYEELAELQRQLALISADPTRTKEAKELRKKIADLQKDISWDIATDEANAQIEAIDDQIKAIDDYASTYEEDLNEMLSNSNNFRDEMDSVMGGSFEDFVNWMKQNNEAYKKSTDEARQQMEWGWEDTWKKMKDELDTYWNEVDETMRSKEGFIEYMQNSDTYRTASETGQKGLIAYWSDLYDDYTASLVDNAEFDHTHEIIDKISELQNWTFNVRLMGEEGYDIQSRYSTYDYDRDHSVIGYTPDTDYAGIGKKYEPPAPAPAGGGAGGDTSSGTSGSSSGKRLLNYFYINASDSIHKKHARYSDGTTAFICNEAHTFSNGVCTKCGRSGGSRITHGNNASTSSSPIGSQTQHFYASGGLVDYTGLAWVDGTRTRPESFLDAKDTALLRSMLDQFTYVKNSPYMTNIDTSKYGNTNISVGDVNVNLYEAKLENDADYDLIAKKVGNAFTKQLQKDGFNLAGYAW